MTRLDLIAALSAAVLNISGAVVEVCPRNDGTFGVSGAPADVDAAELAMVAAGLVLDGTPETDEDFPGIVFATYRRA